MKRNKAARERRDKPLQELAGTVILAQKLIDTDEADAICNDNETTAKLIRAISAQEQLFYVTLAQAGLCQNNKVTHDYLAKQVMVLGDLVMRAYALGVKDGKNENQTAQNS